jgi:ComF family protein
VPLRTLVASTSWLDAALGFFYPEICQYCGQEHATAGQGFVGAECRLNVKFIQPPFCELCGLPVQGAVTTPFECSNCRGTELYFSRARSVVAAQGMVLQIIHRYKYQCEVWFEPFLTELLVQRAGPILRAEKWDLIVPVPLHAVKQSEREFNQAERLALRLSEATCIPFRKDLLRRMAPTRTQTLLTRTERATNVRRAFAPCKKAGAELKGRRVVLVDDVLTTGATTSACAKVLRAQGAEEVCAWTVARGLLK